MSMFRVCRKGFGKREIAMILCTGLILGSLSGCGGEYAGVSQGDGVSGSAVSGSAVSDSADGGAVSGSAIGKEQDISSYPFCTDTNLYYEKDNIIWQARLDGTHKKRLIEGKEDKGVLWVRYADKDWLYYEVWYQNDVRDMLYRAPIRKDKDGYDEVRIADAEKLITEDIMFPAHCGMDSHYFFYGLNEKYIKYDLKEQKKIVLAKEDNEGFGSYKNTYVYKIGEQYAVFINRGVIYALDADGTQWKKVPDDLYGEDEQTFNSVEGEQAIYYKVYTFDDENFYNIKRYDGEKAVYFVTKEQQEDAIMEALHVDKLDDFDTTNLFCQGGRLYIQIAVGWEEKGTFHMEYVILSKEEKSDSKLRYEKELTECMKSHGKNREGKWVDDCVEPEKVFVDSMLVNDAQCIAMADGKAYLSLYDYKKDKGHLGCYDLANGKFQWVEREDVLFYRLGYEKNLDDFITGIFEIGKDEKNEEPYIGLGYVYPQTDEEKDGYFAENP